MAIQFNKIPASVRSPLFYFEIDPSRAGTFGVFTRGLLIGQKLSGGTASANVPILVPNDDLAIAYFGRGSMLVDMVRAYRANNFGGELWCLPLADNGAGVYATGVFSFAGPATANGTINLYIGFNRVQVAVVAGDAATAIATAAAAAINANLDLPVAAAVDGSDLFKVNLTARHKGTLGNDIQLTHSLLGDLGGEALPAGVTVTTTAMASGATDPAVNTGFVNLGDVEYDYIAMPYTDTTNLDYVRTAMNDTDGRWSHARQIFGHVFTAKRATVGALQSYGAARNDEHITTFGFKGSHTPAWKIPADAIGQFHTAIDNHPARPLHGLEMIGMHVPAVADRFTFAENETLAHCGISTFEYRDGVARTLGVYTHYQKNSQGLADNSMLMVNTMYQNMYILRRFRFGLAQKFSRSLLNDRVVDEIRAECVSIYRDLVAGEICENVDLFIKFLVVERDQSNPNRVNILLAPDHANQLEVMAIVNQFRLQFSAAETARAA